MNEFPPKDNSLEKEPDCVIHPVIPEKCNNGTIVIPALTTELDPLNIINRDRKKAWIENEITKILEKGTTLFPTYLEKNLPSQTHTQREKKLNEFYHTIDTMNAILSNWTGITHDSSHVQIVSNQEETMIEDLNAQISENNEPVFADPSYLLADFPQPYYLNNTLLYKASEIKKHLTYVNFDPIQPSITALYKKAVATGIEPSANKQFQNIYINCLLGYMNGIKMLYKTLIMGELIKQIRPNSKNNHLILEEFTDQITDHSLITYIQKPGIVFPLQTVSISKNNNRIFLPKDEEVKDVLTFLIIGTDRKKKYDGIAQFQADQECKYDSTPRTQKYQQTNMLLQKLGANGYDFSASKKHGDAHISDEQTKNDIDYELDVFIYEGNQSAWKKVWNDMKNGVLDELLKN